MWENLGKLHHPELQGLVCSLKATVLTSRAPSTMSKYINAFARWKTWAQQYTEISVFPVKETEFILYMQHVGSTTSSKSAVTEAVNGVSWVQQLAGYPLPPPPPPCIRCPDFRRYPRWPAASASEAESAEGASIRGYDNSISREPG